MNFPYESKLPHWVNRLSYTLRSEVQRRFRAAGYALTAEEWALLMLLWHDEPQTMAALAERSLRDRTTVTRLIDGMVDKELLRRSQSSEDRRRVEIELTETARALEEPLVKIVEQIIADASAGIEPGDVDHATRVLRQMTENLVRPGRENG